jgi:hypothetical protein
MDISSVFVNGRSRPVIMEDMQRRIDRGDLKQEKTDAIQVSLSLPWTSVAGKLKKNDGTAGLIHYNHDG